MRASQSIRKPIVTRATSRWRPKQCASAPLPAAQSYLNVDRILEVARETGAEAIHPGYGFLSENPDFAESCANAGIAFIGPTPNQMRAFGLKHKARELALAAGVPLAPGSGLIRDLDHAREEAARIGYPVMLKSTAGGGGIGLQLIATEAELAPMYERVERLARNNFKDAGLFLEKYVARGRHIEVQLFGDGEGNVVALGERDCSAQRRNQKVIEETPAPGLSDATRKELWNTAIALGKSVNYASAGTVEFLYDSDTNAFYFLEVNTRLQVEHGVTEEVTGVDLVEWMVRQAAGECPPLDQSKIAPCGASIQVRLYAEDPGRDFRPSAGLLTHVSWAPDARIETWVESGSEVSPFYDPMIAKIIVRGSTRAEALTKMQASLAATRIGGLETNLDYLRQLASSAVLADGEMLTQTLATFAYEAPTIEVLVPGTQSTIQDWPGRTGYWAVGVPPSGPMDHLSFRYANKLAGNAGRRTRPRNHARRSHAQVQHRRRHRTHRRGNPCHARRRSHSDVAASSRKSRRNTKDRYGLQRRSTRLSCRARRLRRSSLSRQRVHIHARKIRRPRRSCPHDGRHPPHRRIIRSGTARHNRPRTPRSFPAACHGASLGHWRALRPPRRT